MSKPFDATLKTLVQDHPEDWLRLAGLPIDGSVDVVDADLSTVTTQADKLLRVNGPAPCLLHVELQADLDEYVDVRVLRYNVLAFERHGLPVVSLLVLARPKADSKKLTGTLRCPSPLGGDTLVFHYKVMRVWQEPLETFLNSGLGLLALAVISRVSKQDLPDVVQKISDRLQQEAEPEEAKILWTASYILAGLRYSSRTIDKLFQGVINMRESSTYQAILKEGLQEGRSKGLAEGRVEGRVEGRAQEARNILLMLGEQQFGNPSAQVRQAIDSVADTDALEQMVKRLLKASDWDDLLAS